MPNIDNGHYFLTALVPLLISADASADGMIATPANRLRNLLAMMPTSGGDFSPSLYGEEVSDIRISPFARNTLNHFVRFAVIEDVNYNGRMNGDGIVEALTHVDPAVPQPIDHLSRPYLLFSVEFDPNPHGAPEPDVYLDKLWTTMEPQLRAIFQYCYKFVEVKSAGDFVRYIKRCQIETTMPFGNYWTTRPPLKRIAVAPTVVTAVVVGGLAGWGAARLSLQLGGWRWLLALVLGLVVAIAVAAIAAKRHAARSFPAAPQSDLETILKSLYLQRAFVAFATDHQADDPAALHLAFGKFLDECQPDQPEPCQRPAVVGA